MKRIVIITLFISSLLSLTFNAIAQIKINPDGNIGLGTTSPSTDIHLQGITKINPDAWAGGITIDKYTYNTKYQMTAIKPTTKWYGTLGTPNYYFAFSYVDHMYANQMHINQIRSNKCYQNQGYTFSDAKLKSNIIKINNPIKTLQRLDGKKYNLKINGAGLIKNNKTKKNEYGLIAQEVQKVLPELVELDTVSNLLAINYTGLIPIVIEALKEQQTQIDVQQSQIDELTNRIEKLEKNSSNKITMKASAQSASATNKSVDYQNDQTISDESAMLNQNIPNPFDKNTTIGMYVPTTVSKAVLYIYNMQGNQIASHLISERQNTSITVEGNELEAGMYLYTLVTDGKEVGTKKMILTK